MTDEQSEDLEFEQEGYSGDFKKKRSRGWVFRWGKKSYRDKPDEWFKETLSKLEAFREVSDWCIFGREICPSTGTPHWQGYIYLETIQRGAFMQKKIYGPTYIPANGNHEQNRVYCSKDENYIEFGTMPEERSSKETNQQIWENARIAAREGRMDDIPYYIYRQAHTSLNEEYLLHAPKPAKLDSHCGLWLYGPPGTGKDHILEDMYPGHYEKIKDAKWWDGYRQDITETVIIKEVDREDRWLMGNLRRWADKYPFRCEIKGRCAVIRPKLIVVVSNYKIEECVFEPSLLRALKERFNVGLLGGETKRKPTKFIDLTGLDYETKKQKIQELSEFS